MTKEQHKQQVFDKMLQESTKHGRVDKENMENLMIDEDSKLGQVYVKKEKFRVGDKVKLKESRRDYKGDNLMKFKVGDMIRAMFAVRNRITMSKIYEIVKTDDNNFHILDDTKAERYFTNEGNNEFWRLR